MKIVIHQSLCGEKNKAWDLLRTTMSDLPTAKSIAFKCDLQEQTGDTHWVPAIRGFSEGDCFLIMKTFDDASEDVRRGRKFSHVLIISKDDLLKINDLQPILELLFNKVDKEADIDPIVLDFPVSETKTTVSELFKSRFSKVINGYLNLEEYSNTILWMGQADFDLAVSELWRRLTQDEKVKFSFGISFNNESTNQERINFVAVPETIQSRFLKSNFFLVGKNDSHEPIDFIERMLLGDELAKRSIANFQEVIECPPLSRVDITLVAKGLNTFENLESCSELKRINALSHIVANYSREELKGKKYKTRLIERIILLIGQSSYDDISVLRTFKTESFEDSKKKLSLALKNWMQINIFKLHQESVYFMFFSRLIFKNANWWDKLIEQELRGFLSEIDAANLQVILIWLSESPKILPIVSDFIDKSRETESLFLSKSTKKFPNEIFFELEKLSIKNGWFRLYAKLLSQQFEFKKAISKLLELDRDLDSFDAIEILINEQKPKDVIEIAIQTGDDRLLVKAGELVNKTPKLLEKVDVLNQNSQMIWFNGIKNGNAIDSGFKEFGKHKEKLLNSLIAGKSVSLELLNQISESHHGNLLSFSNRAKLWGKLSEDLKIKFLKKTSSALLEHLSNNSTTEIPDDYVLTDYISEKGISDFLYFNRDNIKSVIPIFHKFSQLEDRNLKDYINHYSGQINAVEATQLGKLIHTKRYGQSADALYHKTSKNNNWKFALFECQSLLDMWQKGNLALSTLFSNVNISSDQWWQSAEELIVELYPNGTTLTTIWKKSGGKESDLIMNTTAGNLWHDLLRKLRNRQFKGVTMNNLLKEVNKQFGHLEKFKILFSLRHNYINTK